MAAIAPWYDLDFGAFDDDIPFYRQLLLAHDDPRLLELGAATGRIAVALAPHARVTAVENNAAMLAAGRQRMINAGVEVIEADMRCLGDSVERGRFTLAIFALSTFQHLLSRSDQIAALRAAATALAPGGRVVLDLTAPSPSDFEFGAQPLSLEWTRTASDGRIVTKLAAQEIRPGSCGIDAASPVADVTYIYDAATADGILTRSLARFPLRVGITVGEVFGLLEAAGLRASACYGDYDLSPPGAGDRLILVAERC